jgi:hypothetical protein
VDYPLRHDDTIVRPWRTATFVAVGVAAVELLLLIIVGGTLLAKPDSGARSTAAAKRATAPPGTKANAGGTEAAAGGATGAKLSFAAELPRRKVLVLILNGNGRQGAAAATATRVSRRGYRIGGVANAPSADFTRSLVMFRRGFEGEGRRLAHDLGIRIVGPLDGMRPKQLHGAQAVVVVGA